MYSFFIQFTQQDITGKWYCHRQRYFFFFPGLIQAKAIIRILSSFARRYKHTYIPHEKLWIDCLYLKMSNSAQKQCLTIDTRDVNNLGPAKFRAQADNALKKFPIILEIRKALASILF